MDDWRDNLSEEERLEIVVEDAEHLMLCRIQRKRAKDAMRRATQRAGNAAIRLTESQRDAMFEIYLEAQRLGELHGIPHEVDHRIPLKGCWRDAKTGRKIHYIRGLHVPENLRAIVGDRNKKRSNMFYTSDPLIVPEVGEYDPFDELEPHFGVPDEEKGIPF